MRLKVHVAPHGDSLATRETMEIHCGQGNQILQWLAQAACARLAHRRGESLGYYVPQSVLDKDGRVLDIDLVLSEAVADGGEVVVEYGAGPLAFRSRWEGRPKTPPFYWSDDSGGERVLPHDAWLAALDLTREGVSGLQEPEFLATGPGVGEADLARVKEVLVNNAGALQMLFLLCTADASTPIDGISRMTLAQLKALLTTARVMVPGGVAADGIDRLFAQVLSSPGALARKAENPGAAPSTLDLPDFMMALVHVAHLRFQAEFFASGPSTTPLSTKLLSLLQESMGTHVLAELQRKLEKLRTSAITPGTMLLLRKGRRLTEQVLDRCQLKRVKARVLRVDLRHVCKHLQRWGLLGKEFGLPDLAPVAVFAKQQHADPHRFVLHPMPLSLDYDEMERLLLGTAHVLAWARKKRTAGGGFEEFLGEFLDAIYKKSGVLIDVPGQQQQAAAASGAPAAATGGPGMGVPGSASKQNLWEAAKSVGPAVPGA